MKINLTEHSDCFALELQAETLCEAAQLTRFGMNPTMEIKFAETSVAGHGVFKTNITFEKREHEVSTVPKNK